MTDHLHEHPPAGGHAVGEARREAMLEELVAAMRRLHRRRRVGRRLAATVAVLLAVGGTAWVVALSQPGPRFVVTSDGDSGIAPRGARAVVVRQSPRTGLVRVIDDAGLVRLLAEIERPAGLIRGEGRVWLTNAVTDAELGRGISHQGERDQPSAIRDQG
ncbi:MAG: hypothetical protein ACYS0G_02775 [Planctomycetota bacterium]|jgi:hypothetical protein